MLANLAGHKTNVMQLAQSTSCVSFLSSFIERELVQPVADPIRLESAIHTLALLASHVSLADVKHALWQNLVERLKHDEDDDMKVLLLELFNRLSKRVCLPLV